MKRRLLFLICFLSVCGFLRAQTFTGAGGAITNDGMATYFTIPVSGLPQATVDGMFGVEEVCIDISHTRVDDLVIHLESPNYTAVELTSTNGGTGANYTSTCFNDTAQSSVTYGAAPFTGAFKPEGYFGRFHDGQPGNGNWRIRIVDVYGGPDAGSVISWSIRFGTNVAQPINFGSSDLPILVINTTQQIKDEPKIMVDMGLIYNGPNIRNYLTDPHNNYSGKAMIEYRGSSSQMFDKKPYSFKLVNAVGNDVEAPLLGMPAGNDWVLHSPYSDKSLLRNHLTYNIANAMGRYAPRTRHIELVLNGRYEGVYVLVESIKRGNDRVNIDKVDDQDLTGDGITGGYIVKIDKLTGSNTDGWYSNIASTSPTDTVFYQYHYPEADQVTAQQKAYIQNYMAMFEQAIMDPNYMDPVNGYRKYVDLGSFVDFFIINELSKNVDAYRISTYMYKDRDSKGGKLTLGPVWDYDIAYANAYYGNATDPSGWQYTGFDITYPTPVWWSRIIQDTAFTTRLKCRWEQLRTSVLDPGNLNVFLDQAAAALNEAQQRNFTMWPTLGVVVWPNPGPALATYQDEVNALKSWTGSRIAWLDQNMPGACNDVFLAIDNTAPLYDELKVHPNPFNSSATLSYSLAEECDVKIVLYDITGRAVKNILSEHKPQGNYTIEVDGSALHSGLYFYQLQTPAGNKICKVLIQK